MPPPGQGSSASLPKPLCSDNLGSANLTDAGVRSMVINGRTLLESRLSLVPPYKIFLNAGESQVVRWAKVDDDTP
jgi:hypothetical protein